MKPENLKIDNPNGGRCSFEEIKNNGDIYFYKFTYIADEEKVPAKISVKWRIPSVGAFSTWNPQTRFNRALRTVMTAGIPGDARVSDGAPVQSLISQDGKNTITFAVSDNVTPIRTNTQIDEEGMGMWCEVAFFVLPVRKMDKYEAMVRIDFSDVPYYDALSAVGKWWREDCGYSEAFVPEFAKDVLYSTWYSYHHRVSTEKIVEQCKLAHKMGMNNIILDAGWGMADSQNRGYGDYFCLCPDIPDMGKMVDEIHKIGMKFMLWFSVPFISHNAKLFEKFGEFVLDPNPNTSWHCLDARYPEVREHIISVYEQAINEWDLDGLKLDFINSFNLSEYSMKEDDRRDFESLEDAVAQLIDDINKRLRKIKPDILIEFRQPYMGAKACQTGNMMRVNDCPNDALYNRVGSIDLRLLTGKTAVHSDMIGWNKGDSPQGVARQLIATLFCVPQISVKIEEQTEEQYKALKFYMDFYTENRATLLDGKIMPLNPEANYAVVIGEKEASAVAVCYSKNYLKIKEYDSLAIVNGTEEDTIVLNNEGSSYAKKITVYDCIGNVLQSGEKTVLEGINVFKIPSCGLLKLS